MIVLVVVNLVFGVFLGSELIKIIINFCLLGMILLVIGKLKWYFVISLGIGVMIGIVVSFLFGVF